MFYRSNFTNYTFINKLGKFYVYLYEDPNTHVPIYIGKGIGSRESVHLNGAINNNASRSNPILYRKIQKLLRHDQEPLIIRLINGVDEATALVAESNLIRAFGRRRKDPNGVLCNIVVEDKFRGGCHNPCFGKFGKEHPAYGCKHTPEQIEKRVSTYKRNAIKFGYNKGHANPRYGDHRTFEEIHGLKKAQAIKQNFSDQRKGANNPNAKCWTLVSPEGDRFYTRCLKSFCETHSLNYRAIILKRSRHKGVTIEWENWTISENLV